MRRVAVLGAAALVMLALAGVAASRTVTVGITGTAFVPGELSIAVGDAVTWENRDTADHQVVSRQAGFTSPVLKAGQSFGYTFTHAGRFQVTDSLPRKTLRMTVTVSSPSITVSLLGVTSQVAYGGRVSLTGAVLGGRAGDQVVIWGQQCGTAAPVKAATVTAVGGGAFTATVLPLRNTRYAAEVGTSMSQDVPVAVRPRLVLRKVATGRYALTVYGSSSFSGRAVVLKRWNGSLKKWVAMRSALLVRARGGTPPTVLSKASFRPTVPVGTRLRASISRFQVGGCYAPSLSNVVRG